MVALLIQSSQREHILESEEFEPTGPPEDRDICTYARRNANSQVQEDRDRSPIAVV